MFSTLINWSMHFPLLSKPQLRCAIRSKREHVEKAEFFWHARDNLSKNFYFSVQRWKCVGSNLSILYGGTSTFSRAAYRVSGWNIITYEQSGSMKETLYLAFRKQKNKCEDSLNSPITIQVRSQKQVI